jgi:hypothetical protein
MLMPSSPPRLPGKLPRPARRPLPRPARNAVNSGARRVRRGVRSGARRVRSGVRSDARRVRSGVRSGAGRRQRPQAPRSSGADQGRTDFPLRTAGSDGPCSHEAALDNEARQRGLGMSLWMSRMSCFRKPCGTNQGRVTLTCAVKDLAANNKTAGNLLRCNQSKKPVEPGGRRCLETGRPQWGFRVA